MHSVYVCFPHTSASGYLTPPHTHTETDLGSSMLWLRTAQAFNSNTLKAEQVDLSELVFSLVYQANSRIARTITHRNPVSKITTATTIIIIYFFLDYKIYLEVFTFFHIVPIVNRRERFTLRLILLSEDILTTMSTLPHFNQGKGQAWRNKEFPSIETHVSSHSYSIDAIRFSLWHYMEKIQCGWRLTLELP